MPRRKPRKYVSQRSVDLMKLMPVDQDQLHRFVSKLLNMDVPRKPMVDGHAAPFDYLKHVFFEGEESFAQHRRAQENAIAKRTTTSQTTDGGTSASLPGRSSERNQDCLVWANRGGGKTMLGAAATVLDLIFKPGIQVRILGGSLGQSSKMFTYLCEMFKHPWLRPGVEGEPTQRRLMLKNQSVVEVLAQSHTSVRGVRVHKLRCDEVEEFDPAVWEAAQLVTRSGRCGIWQVRGAVEALSTMHRPHGLMSRLLGTTLNRDAENTPAQASAWRVFRWSALDVVAPCRLEVACEDCRLWESCGGRARSARGFMAVHDLLTQRARVSDRVWEAEMLCQRPSTSASVYPNFDIARHVQKVEVEGVMPVVWVGGMDFGMRNPTVFLWARVHGEGQQPMDQRLVEIVDEHHQQDLTTGQTLAQLAQRGWPAVKWVGVDPAGAQRNTQSGLSDIQCLQKKGYKVRSMREPLAQGIERIRSRLDHDLLRIDPRCEKLIQALAMYHYDIKRPQCEDPVKDGPDHACDALRYLITNLENHVSKKVVVARY